MTYLLAIRLPSLAARIRMHVISKVTSMTHLRMLPGWAVPRQA
jgi:hypothetical protein